MIVFLRREFLYPIVMKSVRIIILLPVIIAFLNSCILDNNVETLEGSWSCKETSEIYMMGFKGTSIYPVYFALDAEDDNTYYIDNFYQLGDGVSVKIKVSGVSLVLEKQSVDGINFEGRGIIDTSFELINLTYTADDGGGEIDHVEAEYSR